MRRTRCIWALLAAAACLREAGSQTSTWRPMILADHGMVASGHPLASAAGLEVLRAGGNAVDAAIATWAAQGVVEPMMTGIGGDMFILVYLARTREVKFINGSGYAPAAATIERYRALGGIPADGALSVSVPGAVAGAELALARYGRRKLSDVLAPAARLAAEGFPVTPHLARSLRSDKAKLERHGAAPRIWFREGEPLGAGDRVVQGDLAATLRRIGAEGSRGFYRGPVARATVECLKADGGLLGETDLAGFAAEEAAPIRIDYKGIDVYECPPNSQGHVMLQAMRLLEGYDLRQLGHNSADYLHVVTEALKLAFADRNRYVGDPRFVPPIPMRELLSREYARDRRSLIQMDRAIEGEAPPGKLAGAPSAGARYGAPAPLPSEVLPAEVASYGLTTYLAVVDAERNMVSITSSILSTFGSGIVVPGAGYFLNNRMAYFYLDPGDVNALAPRKRTRQTINPALALRDGKPWLVFGTPGADTQPQAQLQFFLNVAEFGMNVQEALEAPCVISSSFRASYYPHDVAGKLQAPLALPAAVREELARRGHRLEVRDVRGVGSVKGILIHPRTNVLMGGVSPTGDSYVLGW